MDNASKALIMAGAILISVAIVGIGIYIFSTANSLTDDAVGQIDSLAVSAINSRIENYFGNNVRGSSLKQLFREVKTMNGQNALPQQVTQNGSPITGNESITDSARYSVSGDYHASGYIEDINWVKTTK